mgnify:CR=1 FL=1
MDYDTAIAYVFRAGVIVSVSLILIGVVALFIEGSSNGYSLSRVSSPYSDVNSSIFLPERVINEISSFRPLDLIFLGLMVLIAIPVIGVWIALIHFILQRNKLYILMAIIVIFNLMFAIFILPSILGK